MPDDEAIVESLKGELAAYEAAGDTEDANAVRAELARYGVKAGSSKRAAKESAKPARKTTSRSRKTTEK